MAGHEAGVGKTTADFRCLYTANFGAITRYALRRVETPEDAADLVAETFLVAWRRRTEMPPGEHARLWLYGVARLVLANHGRGEQRRRQLGERLRLEMREHVIAADPTEELVAVRAAQAALAGLERADREVLELTAWEQLAPREIAIALDLSPEVVRARLSRARARMRARLADQEGLVRSATGTKEGKA